MKRYPAEHLLSNAPVFLYVKEREIKPVSKFAIPNLMFHSRLH